MVDIIRIRYVVILDDEKIFCGLARHYEFKPINHIGNTVIKTYSSEQKAKLGFSSSWYDAEQLLDSGRIKIVRVTEQLKEQKNDEN